MGSYGLKYMSKSYILEPAPKPRNEYALLRAMTTTNTKLHLHSATKNRVNLTIELIDL